LKDSIENNLSKKQDLKDKPIVLIIEDNRDMNYYLTTILKDKYNVIIEANSEKGIITAKNKIPDIIVSDVSLPGMECYRSCKEIKNSHITSHIPIILLTVSDSKEERVKSIKSGADAFLVKPVYEAELTAVIDRLLSTRRQIKDKYSPIKQLNTQGVVYDKGNEANIEFINRVIDLIYKDITNTENIIDNIASEVCLSPSQLNRKIKAITGMTTSNFVLKTRLNRAKKLLTVTQKPIGDIAMECGFNDFAYFSRSFKKEFGMTPTTFQRLPHSAN
jgi:two-component system sensor histidine kinase ChiS